MKIIVLAKVAHYYPTQQRLNKLREAGWMMVHGIDPQSLERIRGIVFSDVVWQHEQVPCSNDAEYAALDNLHRYLETMLREPPMMWIDI